MSQKAIADLYQKSINTINEHIKNIYAEDELRKSATIRQNRIVQTEGRREVERIESFYNLEMILAIGYCGNEVPQQNCHHVLVMRKTKLKEISQCIARLS